MLPSIKSLYRIGPGPSSSHTIGPFNASLDFKSRIKNINYSYIIVTLFGSLALTGKGHLTDKIILEALKDDKVKIEFNIDVIKEHPNTLIFKAYDSKNKLVFSQTYYSIGGGEIKSDGFKSNSMKPVYDFSSFNEFRDRFTKAECSIREFFIKYEGEDIITFAEGIFDQMVKTIEKGLVTEGEVAQKLHVKRMAKEIYSEAMCETDNKRILTLSSYAYAVSECNAAGELIVTAPTCGSAGVLPSVLYYSYKDMHIEKDKIIDGLLIAGLIGLIIRHNATISGAVGGCQAEIGSACSMAAAALCVINSLSIYQTEYAAEIGMEHNLGLTCDPVMGYVAIPCIERNSIAAIKAYVAYVFADKISPLRHNAISLDDVIEVMYQTGLGLSKDFKETSKGGLASIYNKGEK